MRDIAVDTVFLGSCTNGRIEDLRLAAEVIAGRKVADGVRMLVVPGSARVRLQAMAEGLDQVFKDGGRRMARGRLLDVPGHEPRPAQAPGERARPRRTATSKGRQGKGGRTHLVSPPWPRPPPSAAPERPRRPEGD
jgi:3-isopropylmalate/(R)-2-methylmalate dehydratase large subunit